jgi:hypothetical protein
MEPTPYEMLAWITRRIRAGLDDELLEWARSDVEAALAAALPQDLIEEAAAALEKRRIEKLVNAHVA